MIVRLERVVQRWDRDKEKEPQREGRRRTKKIINVSKMM